VLHVRLLFLLLPCLETQSGCCYYLQSPRNFMSRDSRKPSNVVKSRSAPSLLGGYSSIRREDLPSNRFIELGDVALGNSNKRNRNGDPTSADGEHLQEFQPAPDLPQPPIKKRKKPKVRRSSEHQPTVQNSAQLPKPPKLQLPKPQPPRRPKFVAASPLSRPKPPKPPKAQLPKPVPLPLPRKAALPPPPTLVRRVPLAGRRTKPNGRS
jgi:hypothetical protein